MPVWAAAHGEPVFSDPPPGAILPKAPTTVSLRLTMPITAPSTIQVRDDAFRVVDLGNGGIVAGAPSSLAVGLPSLEPGEYTVQWTAHAADGHETTGTFAFVVTGDVPPYRRGSAWLAALAVPAALWIGIRALARQRAAHETG